MNEEASELASIWEHLEEFRHTLIKMAWVILIGTVIAFIFHHSILQFLTKPLQTFQQESLEVYDIKTQRIFNTSKNNVNFELPEGSFLKSIGPNTVTLEKNKFSLPPQSYVDWEQASPAQNLLILSPAEGFSISLKISLWLGFACTSPLWLYFIFQFIAPALHQKEKLLVLPFLGLSTVFIFSGVCFAYLITVPIANQYFFSFNENLGLNLWSLSNYIDYTLLLMLSNAVAFELFVVLLFLVHYGFLKAQNMKDKRRHVIVAVFVLGAILTPPDVLSQLLLAIPMIILYELMIWYALIKKSGRKPAFLLNPNAN